MNTTSPKTILVTGASRGIGKAIALRFAREGWQVAITCLQKKDQLLETAGENEEAGGACLPFVGDMGRMEDCRKLFEQIEEKFGGLDMLVNNAGISYVGLLQDMSEEEWDRLISADVSSVFYCSKLAIPHMIRRRQGRILNISSVWGVCGASCEAAYSAAKGGVNAFTQALAKELAPSGIAVNALACGAIDTDMNRWLTAEERQALFDEIPAGRMGTPEEVACMAYLLSEAPSYLTGQIIRLDGGWI